jgi:hypothetical protein
MQSFKLRAFENICKTKAPTTFGGRGIQGPRDECEIFAVRPTHMRGRRGFRNPLADLAQVERRLGTPPHHLPRLSGENAIR